MSEIEITFSGKTKIDAKIGNHIIKTDQPINQGGEDTAPSPYELFLASLGTCAGIYIKMFCDKRNISTDNIKLTEKVEFDKITGLASNIVYDIYLPSDFPEQYKEALVSVVNLCKVKKQMMNPPEFNIVIN